MFSLQCLIASLIRSSVFKSLSNDYYRAPGVDNWTIIELQGTLETKEDVSLEGKAIGDLHFDGKVGKTIERLSSLTWLIINPGCIPHRPHAEVTPSALKMYAE